MIDLYELARLEREATPCCWARRVPWLRPRVAAGAYGASSPVASSAVKAELQVEAILHAIRDAHTHNFSAGATIELMSRAARIGGVK